MSMTAKRVRLVQDRPAQDPGSAAPPIKWLKGIHVAALVLALSTVACVLLVRVPFIFDEGLHWRQVSLFLAGRFVNYLPIIAGYHAVVASLAYVTGLKSPMAVRLFSLGFGLLSVLVFYRSARIIDSSSALGRTLLYFLIPILFPLFFLLYTDVFSLLVLLLAVLAYLRQRHLLAGLIGSLSILVRQNNVVWLVLLFVMTYYDQHGFRVNFSSIVRHLRTSWTYLLGVVGFVVFVIVNRGVAINASPEPFELMIQPGGHLLHAGNLFFSLLVLFGIWMPSLLFRAATMGRFRRAHRLVFASVALGGLLFLLTFVSNHPWNQKLRILGNTLLVFSRSGPGSKMLLYLPMAVALGWLCTTPLARKSMYFLYVFWAISLLPIWVIQPRYYLPQIVLLLLFRRREDPRVEMATIVYALVASGAVFLGMVHRRFFI
jgi:alpha-1,2-glucosyltransferase